MADLGATAIIQAADLPVRTTTLSLAQAVIQSSDLPVRMTTLTLTQAVVFSPDLPVRKTMLALTAKMPEIARVRVMPTPKRWNGSAWVTIPHP